MMLGMFVNPYITLSEGARTLQKQKALPRASDSVLQLHVSQYNGKPEAIWRGVVTCSRCAVQRRCGMRLRSFMRTEHIRLARGASKFPLGLLFFMLDFARLINVH